MGTACAKTISNHWLSFRDRTPGVVVVVRSSRGVKSSFSPSASEAGMLELATDERVRRYTHVRGGSKTRKILVAVDGSQQSNAALAIAIDLAQRYRASLCLLHAFAHVSDLLGMPQYEHLLEARSALGQQVLESAQAQVGDSVPVETQLIE